MQQFKTNNKRNLIILDYSLAEEEVPAGFIRYHQQMLQIMSSFVQQRINMNSGGTMVELVNSLERQVHQVRSLSEIEERINGKATIFQQRGEGVVEMLSFHI